MSSMKETEKPRSRAVLVGIQLPRVSELDNEASLAELGRLVHTLGYDVIGSLCQKRPSLAGSVVLGEGKLKDLARWTGGPGEVQSSVQVKRHKAAERFKSNQDAEDDDAQDDEDDEAGIDGDIEAQDVDGASDDSPAALDGARPTSELADVVVFDCELTPSQMRNLESATAAKVLDRTGVIIEIFSRHARTRAAQLQVEIARLNYLAPRLRETQAGGDRQGGGIGAKGAGETSLELDRRRIRDRVKELREELESVQHEHSVRRARRSSENTVALVGYTNAGKSSLMRALTGSEVYVADKLFATLDTTVRPVAPETMPKILISDTVGFIKKLPHDLVASFRSTLDEASNANLLFYVVDAADPTFREQLAVTKTVLTEIGVVETPSRLVLNKKDRLTPEQCEELAREFPDAILISTRDTNDIAMLRDNLLEFFEREMIDETVFLPYNLKGAIGEIRAQMRVLDEAFDEHGVQLRVRALPTQLERLRSKYSL
jgi:GTPase